MRFSFKDNAPENAIEWIQTAIQELLAHMVRGSSSDDYVGLVFENEEFPDRPVYISFRKLSQYNVAMKRQIYRWNKRHRDDEAERSLQTKPRPGAPKKKPGAEEQKRIEEVMNQTLFTSSSVLRERLQLPVSLNTVQRSNKLNLSKTFRKLHELGFHRRMPARRLLLTEAQQVILQLRYVQTLKTTFTSNQIIF
ncbi:hypothetical protein TcasGA2_TC002037 [Tribolium castaneum]|uniref:Transposase Tc1-like domain-containing protein n=1 Tax=Tribolium castaneum TaxID=7070 RepID=D7ELF9_TRICA|nr:hypothetical protein TcasGA2_TC002037 [Tribolium castaneum]